MNRGQGLEEEEEVQEGEGVEALREGAMVEAKEGSRGGVDRPSNRVRDGVIGVRAAVRVGAGETAMQIGAKEERIEEGIEEGKEEGKEWTIGVLVGRGTEEG